MRCPFGYRKTTNTNHSLAPSIILPSYCLPKGSEKFDRSESCPGQEGKRHITWEHPAVQRCSQKLFVVYYFVAFLLPTRVSAHINDLISARDVVALGQSGVVVSKGSQQLGVASRLIVFPCAHQKPQGHAVPVPLPPELQPPQPLVEAFILERLCYLPPWLGLGKAMVDFPACSSGSGFLP